MVFPHWTVETKRRYGWKRRPREVLLPQQNPESLGHWLEGYRRKSGDEGMQEILVLEHPLPGIEPFAVDPHQFIQAFRDSRRHAAQEDYEFFQRDL